MRGSGRPSWKHWTEAEARAVLVELGESGSSVAGFARERGVSIGRLTYWRKRLAAPPPVPAFVEARAASPKDETRSAIEILAGGIVLRVREETPAERLAEIVTALGRRGRSC